MENNNIPVPAPKRAGSSVVDTAVKTINAVWTLILIVLVISAAAWAISWKMDASKEPEYGMTQFIALASPIETKAQPFTIGRHAMPQLAVMAPLPEAERVANPSLTAAQLQRAKWMDRTWKAGQLRNESNRALPGAGKSSVSTFVTGVVSDVMEKKGQSPLDAHSIEELSNINVLVGNDVIPSLASGLLPVFTDAETAKWKAELARERITLNEIDMRRAKFFQKKFGPGTMPAKSPDDIEIRTAEKLESQAQKQPQNLTFADQMAAMQAAQAQGFSRQQTAPLSDNERLEAACQVLNSVTNPALIPLADAAPAPSKAQLVKSHL
jgi:hypothetical protein